MAAKVLFFNEKMQYIHYKNQKNKYNNTSSGPVHPKFTDKNVPAKLTIHRLIYSEAGNFKFML
jgi:hypothetical protein